MTTFYTQRRKNRTKTYLFMLIFLGIILGLGWFLSYRFHNPVILYASLVLSLGMNIWAYWFSDRTVLSMTGAREVSFKQAPELHRIIENLSITAGLPKPKVFIIDDAAPNAFATGRDKKHAVVAVTTGLLEILDKSELEGVIAHELSHIGNSDMLLSTVVVVLVGMITMASDILLRGSVFGGKKDEQGNAFVLIIGLVLALLMPLVGSLLRMAISRKRELLADATAVMIIRYPQGLIGALEKIHAHAPKMRTANHATAHLFIANPFGAKSTLTYINKLFSTHPPVELRVKLLRKMDK